ncbi:MAG TPA: hypothetical protein GYA08_16185 [Chloroflexi bacterium]|nr:hypothetical protein [Chloroflexota bacterium]
MKLVELDRTSPSLQEVIDWAEHELVVLRQADGSVFALSQVDDFAVETSMLEANPEFAAFLQQLSEDDNTMSSDDVRKELGLS